eukprot:Sro62_g035410.1 n/a (600) ;mRNA; f:83409-85617
MKRGAAQQHDDFTYDMSTSYPHEKSPPTTPQHSPKPRAYMSDTRRGLPVLKKAPPTPYGLYPSMTATAKPDDETKSTLSESCASSYDRSVGGKSSTTGTRGSHLKPCPEMLDHSSSTRGGGGEMEDDVSVSVRHLFAEEAAEALTNVSGHSSTYWNGDASATSRRRRQEAYHNMSYGQDHSRRPRDEQHRPHSYPPESHHRSNSTIMSHDGGPRRRHQDGGESRRREPLRSQGEDRRHRSFQEEAPPYYERGYQPRSQRRGHAFSKSEPYIHYDYEADCGGLDRHHQPRGNAFRQYREEQALLPVYAPMDMYQDRRPRNHPYRHSDNSMPMMRREESSLPGADSYHHHHGRSHPRRYSERTSLHSRSLSYDEDPQRRPGRREVRRFHSEPDALLQEQYSGRDLYDRCYAEEKNTPPRDVYGSNSPQGSHHSAELRVESTRGQQQSRSRGSSFDSLTKGETTKKGSLKQAPLAAATGKKKAPPPAPAQKPQDDTSDVFLEVAPGVKAKLRLSHETKDAIAANFYTPTVCWGCCAALYCISDAAFLICPNCTVISPLEQESLPGSNGIGMAFTKDTLLKVQEELRSESSYAKTHGKGKAVC